MYVHTLFQDSKTDNLIIYVVSNTDLDYHIKFHYVFSLLQQSTHTGMIKLHIYFYSLTM